MTSIASLKGKDIMAGLTMSVRVSPIFTMRTSLACWLLRMAGKVMDVPCEIEMRTIGEIRPGDVVYDAFSRDVLMTVEYVHGAMAHCVWFDRDHSLHRRTIGVSKLTIADD